jgi:hypothetical protein
VSRKRRSKNRKTDRRLLAGASVEAAPLHWSIPTRWLNSVYAIFLLPIAWTLTATLFSAFSRAAVQNAFWATEEFWFFALGAALWTIAFLGAVWIYGEPRPLRLYIFGHELTHAVWVWAMGGRVSRFEVAREGGHIVNDTHIFWIALAPYFYPLYTFAIIAIYGIVSVFHDVAPYTSVLFALIGLTWAFHISFTLWMIPRGQTDLTYHGTFFSLVVIYLMNLVLLTALLIFAAPEVTFAGFATEFLANADRLCSFAGELL